MITTPLTGILVALPTPFTVEDIIDESALCALVDRVIEGGVHGVVACGSTGEFAALSLDERKQVVEIIIDQVDGRVPVIAQTGATRTSDAITLSHHAEQAGASIIMPVAPYYEPLTESETVNYLGRVAESVTLPVMLYNIPTATGVNLQPETIATLAHHIPNIQYVKNTTTDFAQSAELIHNYGDLISTFVGWDSLTLASLVSGAAGVLAGTANIVPTQLVAIYDAIQAGNLEAAQRTWIQIYPLLNAALQVNFIAAVKTALETIGIPVGSPRQPFLPLNEEDAKRISQLAAPFRIKEESQN